MAETATAYYNGIAFAATKSMAAVHNAASSETLKIRRVGLLNAQTAGVIGVLCALEFQFFGSTTTLAAGTAVTPTQHDSNNAGYAAARFNHNATPAVGTSSVLRRIFWSSDEAAISTATNDELETFVPLNIIFDAGYGDSTNVQPLTLRGAGGGAGTSGQAACLFNQSGAAGLLDTWIEVTRE